MIVMIPLVCVSFEPYICSMRILTSVHTKGQLELSKDFVVDVAADGAEIAYLMCVNSYDAIIINDIGEVPYNKLAPVFLAITEYDSVLKVKALNSGVDACVKHPVFADEIRAELNCIKRLQSSLISNEVQIKNLVANITDKNVFIDKKKIKLRRKEYEILEHLLLSIGRIVSKEELLEHIWESGVYVLSNTVEVHVRNLRKKIGRSIIHTKHTKGYVIYSA